MSKIQADEIGILIDASDRLVSGVSTDFCRYLSSQVNWSERLLCIKGPKGQQTAAVVRGKIAKKKLSSKEETDD